MTTKEPWRMTRKQAVEERYTSAEIRRYEAVFGRHFISPGGLDSTRQFLELVELNPRSCVLDVGCGIGAAPSTWPATLDVTWMDSTSRPR